jgi:hypothetical protein
MRSSGSTSDDHHVLVAAVCCSVHAFRVQVVPGRNGPATHGYDPDDPKKLNPTFQKAYLFTALMFVGGMLAACR